MILARQKNAIGTAEILNRNAGLVLGCNISVRPIDRTRPDPSARQVQLPLQYVMPRPTKPIRSDLAWSTPDRIVVRGKDLPGAILGHMNLGDMAFLELTGRE